jgi:uncharacterized cupredoxin-like copper-binding protein
LGTILAQPRKPSYSLRVTLTPPPEPPATPSQRRISRAPVVVVVLFFTVAITLVVIGAQLSLSPPPDVTIASPGTADAPRAINVIMRDYRFDPTPVILMPGETVRITLFNAGMVPHEMALGDAAVQRAWAQADAAATPPAPFATAPPASVPPDTGGLRVVLASGQQQVVDYVVPGEGEVLLLCNLPGHVERGMVVDVELRVPGGSAASPSASPSAVPPG